MCGREILLGVCVIVPALNCLLVHLRQKLESADVEVGKLKEALQKREESERGLQGM